MKGATGFGAATMDVGAEVEAMEGVTRVGEVIGFLLSSEIIPLCMSKKEIGKELLKIVIWGIMFASLKNQPLPRLLKLIIPCYLRLSKHCNCLLNRLTYVNFINCLRVCIS
ncbi:hypothetical protein MTR_1g043520 [Medicago truncatula]|uniref:Uncharacterized protein n=1 Tax=Medicago truncatula TaxID=3880 RepID=G7I5F6_MEDTR|nr:hypothetical protein MTR_1g043520 [Medicago truncatula]